MNNWLIELFTQNSIAHTIAIYGLVIAIGSWLGRFKFLGISLGVTWILFMGLILSYLGISVDVPTKNFLKEFGLILFVYCIGLQVGPGFFASLKKNAYISNLLAFLIVLLGVGMTLLFFLFGHNSISVMTGILSGSVTNTPGLGAAQTTAVDMHLPAVNNSMITLAYALAYPFGVFGIIISILLLKKIFRVNVDRELRFHELMRLRKVRKPVSYNLTVENKHLSGKPISRISELLRQPVAISRVFHEGAISTANPKTLIYEGDILVVVALPDQLEQLKIIIGNESPIDLTALPESDLISRRIVVTRPEVTHKRMGDIAELQHSGFTLTRLNRAGVEIIPYPDVILQMGDTLNVVGTRSGVELVSGALGNSLKRLEAPDLSAIFMGIVLGVLLGSVPLNFPNIPVPVKIGLAGGPLIVALILSRFGNLIYLNNYTTSSANHLVREMGIALFLASVGLGSGHDLAMAFHGGNVWFWIIMALCISIIPLVLTGIIAKLLCHKTYFEIIGLLSGASTDPPALAFSMQIAKCDVPSVAYATVYPLTMILRIIAAQLLMLFFS